MKRYKFQQGFDISGKNRKTLFITLTVDTEGMEMKNLDALSRVVGNECRRLIGEQLEQEEGGGFGKWQKGLN